MRGPRRGLALNGLTQSLAQAFAADDIRVIGIALGMVASEALLSRLADVQKGGGRPRADDQAVGLSPDDLVGMVLLLCSDDASFATGQTFTVDGGFVKHI